MTTMQIDRAVVEQALEALEKYATHGPLPGRCPVREAEYALKAALVQPKFTLSCGCPSQYGGVPAYWDRDGSTAFGMICEKHWHEYGARSEA